MDDNVGKGLASLAVATVGALTFVAYKHPRAYQKLLQVLVVVGLGISLSCLTWDICIVTSESTLARSGVLPKDKVNEILDTLQLPIWVNIAILGAILYLMFLLTFPYWLKENEPPQS
jgi:hypothetical protein